VKGEWKVKAEVQAPVKQKLNLWYSIMLTFMAVPTQSGSRNNMSVKHTNICTFLF